MLSTPLLAVNTARRNGVAVVSLVGELDAASIRHLEEEFAAIERSGTSDILLDFGLLAFIDSTGLHWLDRVQKRANSAGWVVAVSNDQAVKRTFEIAGMASLLNSKAAGELFERFSRAGNGHALTSARSDDHA